jgi:hypothetical protein
MKTLERSVAIALFIQGMVLAPTSFTAIEFLARLLCVGPDPVGSLQ